MTYSTEIIAQNNDIIVKVLTYDQASTPNFDMSLFTPKEQATLLSFKSPKRQLEFYFSRVLWLSLNINDTVTHLPSGKPTLKNHFVSMTHSGNMVAIALSKNGEIGIDLEPISDKIDRVKHKILHHKDSYNSLKELTQLWTIKESFYKLFDGQDLFFMNDVLTTKLTKDLALAECHVNNQKLCAQIDFTYLKDDYILAIAKKGVFN